MVRTAVAVKERKSCLHEDLDKLFRTDPNPEKARNGSGRTIIVEHAMGKAGGMLTEDELFKKLGLADTYSDRVKEIARQYKRDDEAIDTLCKAAKKKAKNRLRSTIESFRAHLDKFYAPQGAKACFIKLTLDDGKEVYYISGLVDPTTLSPLVGDLDDLSRVAYEIHKGTFSANRRHFEGRRMAEQIRKLPNLNRDVRERVDLILADKLFPKIEHKK